MFAALHVDLRSSVSCSGVLFCAYAMQQTFRVLELLLFGLPDLAHVRDIFS